jgi:hypothetical protein
MRRTNRCVLVAIAVCWPAAAWAQTAPVVRPHIWLPPSYGATPLSTIIHANAALTAAQGDFLESQANARHTNALAAQQEMKNSVDWVRTYFQRKELNRQYTRMPSFIERERGRVELARRLIERDYQLELRTDPTDKLNFMLLELNVLAPPEAFYSGVAESLVNTTFDAPLSTAELSHVRLTDGGPTGQRLEFAASETALRTDWPHALAAPEFAAGRKAVEQARAAAVEELKGDRELSHAGAERLRAALDALSEAYAAAYPRPRRTASMQAFGEYLAGERCLQSLAVGVHRMIMTREAAALDGSLRFEGDSVADLVANMHKLGLEFAPWQSGDEGVYQKLFVTLRRMYQHVAGEAARKTS